MRVVGYCYGCDNPLTGKQRKWCSDACRKRFERLMSANRPGSSANRPLNGSNVRESSGFVRVPSANEIIVSVVIRYNDNGMTAEWDGYVIKSKFKIELQQFIAQKLPDLMRRYTFEIISLDIRKG